MGLDKQSSAYGPLNSCARSSGSAFTSRSFPPGVGAKPNRTHLESQVSHVGVWVFDLLPFHKMRCLFPRPAAELQRLRHKAGGRVGAVNNFGGHLGSSG